MKIGRNDPCPCGSGKKYKNCCLNKKGQYMNGGASEYEAIRNIVHDAGSDDKLADILCSLLRFMQMKQWIGACHATTAVMYVALSESGFAPRCCIGEVFDNMFTLFDHSWIELDGKIIDLACAMTLLGNGNPISAPIVLDVDTYSGGKYDMDYGVYKYGLGLEAQMVMESPFVQFMDAYPDSPNGLWDIVGVVLGKKLDIDEMRKKYATAHFDYIRK